MSNLTQARKLPKNAAADKPARKQSEFRRVIGLLGRFVSRQRAPFILAFIMLLIEVVSDLASKYTVPYLLDYLKGDKPEPLLALGLPYTLGSMGTVALLLGGFVILALINSSSDSASEIFLARGGRMMGYNLR
ncbi:MAG: hypothetical protein ABIV47_03120, partial [Roseiflexaceae bacterium]